jgi:crotonobetainyl-CoA:carnitine CoA-transferase CaiB-like acyl-CoA transferase
MSLQALSGLKVVEWSEFVSGPYCGKLLADLGADVIKVERPSLGDRARRYGPFPEGIPHPEKSGLFLYLNTNKLGVTLNVGSASGAELLKELMKQADVLVQNNPPRYVEELELDYEHLKNVSPRLVMTSIAPFGQTGPNRDNKSCNLTAFHASGMAFVNPSDGVDDTEAKPPLQGPEHQAGLLAGLSAAIGTMSAVFAQQMSGLGQHVDLSEQEALASITRRELAVYAAEGLGWTRLKGSQPGMASDIYQCSDGRVYLICFHDRPWESWLEVMGNPEWAYSELFLDIATRRDNWDAAKVMIEEFTKEHTVDEILRATEPRRIPCKPVNTAKQLVESELLAERDFFAEVSHKEAGNVKFPGAPCKLSETPWSVQRPAPLLGEHNEEVYCGRLGYTKQDLVRLRAGGVI